MPRERAQLSAPSVRNLSRYRLLARSRPQWRGKACPLCPVSSDVDLLCYCEWIIDINSQILNGAVDFGVPAWEHDEHFFA